MSTTTTPLMNLELPDVSLELGPLWATDLNNAFLEVDSHDHTPGKGSKIRVASLLVSEDFDLLAYALVNVKDVEFYNNASALSAATYPGAVYIAQGELYYNDESGHQVRLTSGGHIDVASVDGIGGDYGTDPNASVEYFTAPETYYFRTAPNLYAKMYGGDIKIFERVASGHSVGLQAPVGLGSDYDLTLFPILPGSSLPVSLTGAGQLYTQQITTSQITFGNITNALMATDSVSTGNIIDQNVTTAKIADGNVTVGKLAANAALDNITAGSITNAKMSTDSIATGNIITRAVTPQKLSAYNYQASAEINGTFGPGYIPNFSVTITASGIRPILVFITGNWMRAATSSGTPITLHRDVGNMDIMNIQIQEDYVPGSCLTFIDNPAAGATTYSIRASGTLTITGCRLCAYEL